MADDPKKILITALPILVIIKNKQYPGVIIGQDGDNAFLVRLTRPDQTVLTVMLDSKCMMQCITDEGLAYKFEANLCSKKIPVMGFKYPTVELEGVNVRKHPRIPVSYWVVMLEPGNSSENKQIGEGNLVDMSEGGCRLMTGSKLKVNDLVCLSFEYQEGEDPLRFKGKIRQVRVAPHDLIYYGIQFEEISPDFLKIVKAILQNPQL